MKDFSLSNFRLDFKFNNKQLKLSIIDMENLFYEMIKSKNLFITKIDWMIKEEEYMKVENRIKNSYFILREGRIRED